MVLRPMRVLFITEEFPPTIGGVGVSCERLSRNLASAGAQIVVITFDNSLPIDRPGYAEKSQHGGVEVWRIGPFYHRNATVQPDRLAESVKASLRQQLFDKMEAVAVAFRPDVILSFYLVNAGLLGAYLSAHLDVPFVSSARGADLGRNIFSQTELPLLDRILKASASIVCVNQYLMQRLNFAFPEFRHKASVIWNGVDLPVRPHDTSTRNYTARYGWTEKDVLAVFVGEPREKKGVATLLQAMASMPRDCGIKLLMIGEPVADSNPIAGTLRKLRECNLVQCTGRIPRGEAIAILSEGDLVVAPSWEDGLSNGLLEGVSMGLFPIVSDVFGDFAAAFPSVVVPRRESAPLARALSDCCKRVVELRAQRSHIQNKAAEMFSTERECNAYSDLFRTCIANYRKGDGGGCCSRRGEKA